MMSIKSLDLNIILLFFLDIVITIGDILLDTDNGNALYQEEINVIKSLIGK